MLNTGTNGKSAEKKLRKIASDLTYKYFGNSLAIGKYFIYNRRPVKIVDGKFMSNGRLSNYWSWRRVLSSGALSERTVSGYGGSDSVFKPISKEEAIKLAVELSNKK